MKKILLALCASCMISVGAQAWAIDGNDYVGVSLISGTGDIDGNSYLRKSVAFEIGRRVENIYIGITADYSVYDEEGNSLYDNTDIKGGEFLIKAGYSPFQWAVLYGLVGISISNSGNNIVSGAGLRVNPFDHVGFFVESKELSIELNNKTYTQKGIDGGVFLYLRF